MTNKERFGFDSNRRRFLKTLSVASTVGATGLAGCLTGGGNGNEQPVGNGSEGSGGNSNNGSGGGGGSNGNGTGDSGSGSRRDFGGQSINVMLNVGPIAEVHRRFLIPKLEQKYNLKVNAQTSVTTQQLTQIQANPNNPPDVIIPDVIGIAKAHRKGWLEPLKDHTEIVTNLNKIYDKFVHYESTGVSWEVGAVAPVINTNAWDGRPKSYPEVMKQAKSVSLVPFSWSGGPYLLLMAAAVATGKDYTSSNLDVEAGFQYLEKNVKPSVNNTYQGVASAKQLLASGNVDTLLVFWDYMVFDMFKNDAPIEVLFQPDPTGIAFAECVAVPNGSNNIEAAMTYANECLSAEFQEKASETMGCGVTNKQAEVAPLAKEFGAITSEGFDQLAFPDFGYIWENRSQWSQRWAEVFSG